MFEKIMFKKVELWVVGLIVVVMLGFAYVLGWAIHHQLMGGKRLGPVGAVLVDLVELPHNILAGLRGDVLRHPLAAIEQRFEGQAGFAFAPNQTGEPARPYWLLSRYDGDLGRGVVELVDLDAGATVHRWMMDAERFFADQMPLQGFSGFGTYPITNDNFRPVHPWLYEDGSMVLLHHSTPLVRLNLCADAEWVEANHIYHHAIEADSDGNIWTSSYMPQTVDDVMAGPFLYDAVIKVSPMGQVLYKKSVMDMLESAGLEGLLYGIGIGKSADPMHLNDVQPVLSDGPYWQKGDLFLSLRNLSMIVLYRPSEDRVIWHKIGPWVGQHDVDILDDHRISVFSNETIEDGSGLSVREGRNRVIVYDFATQTTSGALDDALAANEVRTAQEGLSDILPDGSVIVEETEKGRALHFGPDGSVRWSYVNRAADGTVYQLGWSRPVSRTLGDKVVASLAATTCPAQ
ncbi:MAG: arylsulfotransferase family protein [Alphaproteobacteria bacterium]